VAEAAPDLFGRRSAVLPEGFSYQPDALTEEQEAALLREFTGLDFSPFQFHGFVGKRRVVSFGWRYDFNGGGLTPTEPLPSFLLPVRDIAGAFANIPPGEFQQALITEYGPGATIGWHRDRSVFAEVVGLSLLSDCTFRLRRRNGDRFERASLNVARRSIYLLSGASRSEWEHSIPEVDALRYSITFRRLKQRERSRPVNTGTGR
jgi:alkylated DNA repair dioxygenase AlkB